MRSRLLAVLIVASLALAPFIGAQTGEDNIQNRETERVTFFGSVFGHELGSPMPANTLPPIGEDNYGLGSFGSCSTLNPTSTEVNGIPVREDCRDSEWNKLALFSSPGPVEVSNREEFIANGGYALLHNERGQTTDIHLDASGSITAGVYITWDTHVWSVGTGETNCLHPHPENIPCVYPSWGWDPGAFEDVVVTATLYAADLGDFQSMASEPPPIQEHIESGDVREIAHGQWGPDQVINGLPGYPQAIHYEIDLGSAQTDKIQQNEDFFIVFDSYQETNGENYNHVSPLRWYGGEFFPATFEMPVKNAITVERVLPNFVHGQLALVSVVNMPWGSYDVSDENIVFDIQGPDGQPVTPSAEHSRSLDIDQSLAHGGHYQPVNKTVIWDYASDDAEPGTYDVTVTATNLQGSATHSCTGSFTLLEGDEGELRRGPIDVGLCGEQTIGDEDLGDVLEDAGEEASE